MPNIFAPSPRVSREVKGDPHESRVFVGAPDYRVFVWGVEVSADVFSVSTTLTVNDAVSTAMVNIVNDNEKWIVPSQWQTLDLEQIDEFTALGMLDFATSTVSGATKIDTLEFMIQKHNNMLRRLIKDIPLPDAEIKKIVSKMKNSTIYPMMPGSSVFQMADPIRIFLKNPWGLDEDQDEWYFAFTGYIATATEDFDAQSNRSVIRLQCEDIRRLLRYMRTTTNPNVFDMNVYNNPVLFPNGVQQTNEAIFDENEKRQKAQKASDLNLVTGSTSILAGLKIIKSGDKSDKNDKGLMELLLYGDTAQFGGSALTGASLIAAGVLGFSKESQKIHHLAVDDNYEDLVSPILDEMYPILNSEQVDKFGADWSLGQDESVRPEPNHLFVILPDKDHFPPLKYPPDWTMRIDFYSEFRSRMDVINEFVQQADLWWYATPKGDIVVEFPAYDALPQIHKAPWNSVLTLQNEFTRFSYTEDDHEIKTFSIFSGSAFDSQDTSTSAPFLAFAPHPNPELIARYGIREQRSNRPFLYDHTTLPGAIEGITLMLQEQANSEAYRLDGLEMLPNYRAVPGRPYHFIFRNLIGFCDQVSQQCVWGGLAQTVYHFKYIRHFDPVAMDWTKVSGTYGWTWKNSLGGSGGGAVPETTKAVAHPGVAGTQKHLLDQLRNAELGGRYTPEQLDRLRDIANHFDPSNPPTSRVAAAYISDFNAILAAPPEPLPLF